MHKFITVLFKRHKKHLSKRLRSSKIGELLEFGIAIFVSAWFFQGMLYMNWRETVIKILLDILLIFIFFLIGLPLWLTFILAHTLNFAFNGQLYAMYTHMGATNVSPKKFLQETISSSIRISKIDSISAAIAYGSLSRGLYKSTSDIDIRYVPKKGELNFWKACFFALKERFLAFIHCYPLDLYVFDEDTLQKKMRIDELPIIIYENGKSMYPIYKERIELDEFIILFKEKNTR